MHYYKNKRKKARFNIVWGFSIIILSALFAFLSDGNGDRFVNGIEIWFGIMSFATGIAGVWVLGWGLVDYYNNIN